VGRKNFRKARMIRKLIVSIVLESRKKDQIYAGVAATVRAIGCRSNATISTSQYGAIRVDSDPWDDIQISPCVTGSFSARNE
jgi:hypothetical protein